MNAISRPIVPGIYDMDADTYHRDPCDTPSLSAGMINDILIAPAKCRHNSRRLNRDWEEPEGAEKFSIGSVAHIMFLEPHLFDEKVVIVRHDDWRKRDAQDAKDDAKAAGKTAILAKHMEKITAARDVFLANTFTAKAFENGRAEQAMFWKHPVYGFWCRARPDFIADSRAHLNDYKATANADPERFGKHAYDMGYHRRAAWYLEGSEILFGTRPDHYWFCNQEVRAPYLTSVIELDRQALEAGRLENDLAAERFADCLKTDDWPGYRHPNKPDRDLAFQVSLPNWAYTRMDERIAL